MNLQKFKLSVENKNNIAREVKEELIKSLQKNEYAELNIFYDADAEKFFIDIFGDRDKLESNGYCFYCSISWYKEDGKPTIKALKEIIFK